VMTAFLIMKLPVSIAWSMEEGWQPLAAHPSPPTIVAHL
jgi:hypothetical protein